MANIWRDPIFDRTSFDVAFALQQLSAWKQSHIHTADVKVENDSLHLNEGEVTYVDGELVVLQTSGVARVENEVLILELGAVYDLKGCLNLSDLTRIEDNISYIANRLIQYQYHTNVYCKEWVKESLPTALDMKRIANNIRTILNNFYTPPGTVEMTDIMLSYEDINALERNLYLVKQLLDLMENSFIKSGTRKCGSTTRLPIRR